MTVKLKTLRFDRQTSGGAPAAIPVRVDKASSVPQLDWKRTGANIDATSVAYPLTMSEADVDDLRVTATFTASSAPTAAFFVRAIGQDGRLLGDVVKARIAPADIGDEHQLQLDDVLLRATPVGQHTVEWKWEQSADGLSGWQEFDRSTHEIFVTVGQPSAPWGRPGVPHTIVPWQAMMQLASEWANGTSDAKAATEAITAAVDDLAGTPIGRSGRVVGYGDPGALVADKRFSVSILLEIVKARDQIPPRLNCRDLNTAVAINATLLGCPVRVVRLKPTTPTPGAAMATNPIKVFGAAAAEPFSFGYHEAATIPGPPIDNRQVFDACVRVDFDTQPQQTPPSQFRLPAGVSIHQTTADMGYRKRLLTPGSQNCLIEEAEGDGIRYPDDLPADGPASVIADPFIRQRREHFASVLSKQPTSLPLPGTSSNEIQQFAASNLEDEGFPRNVPVGELETVLSFTPIKLSAFNGRVEISIADARDRQQAIELFARLAADYTATLESRDDIGDFTLHDPRSGAVLMLRGSVVVEINVRRRGTDEAPSILNEARRFDAMLNRFYTTPSR
jgi:hypothetical protein